MSLFPPNPPRSQVAAIAARRQVHQAFAWLHANPKTILDWQLALVSIPAPPFGEAARSAWMADRFLEAGLDDIAIDSIGNVFATLPAAQLPPDATGPVVLLSAHLDTVFPAETTLNPSLDGDLLTCPGATDNAAGVVGMLAIANALRQSQIVLPAPLLFCGNVGEEGEGDLRGVRHIYATNPIAERIAVHIVLDGAGHDSAVSQALGSLRFEVLIEGPGGHSFTDFGTPNPIAALSAALATLAGTPLPDQPRTTLNLGTIHGGTSVNSIPQTARAAVDFRSTSPDELIRLEVALHRAVEDSVAAINQKSPATSRGPLRYQISKIGDRPAAALPAESPLLVTLRAVDRHLNIRTDLRLGSTDANIPLSLGVPSLSLGAGGEGAGAHTLAEWYSAANRELGLRRILLLALAMLDHAAGQ
jgi:acetylornithine deacetylase/succinyl-diaminopimelate desuccinylase-like protein